MRILYHHRTLGDGAEGIHVAAIVKAFRQLGHEVKVTSVIGEKTNVSTRKTRILEKVVRHLPRAFYEILELAYSIVGFRSLLREIARFKPQMIYERYALFNFAGVLAAKRKRIPLVLEVNAPLAYEREKFEILCWKTLAYRCEKRICSLASRVVVVSTPLREYLINLGVSPEKIKVLPNGVDTEVFKPDETARQNIRRKLNIAAETVVIGFVGILRPWHGVDLLLQAAAKLQPECNGFHVLIVGDGPSMQELKHLTQTLKLQGKVTFTGRVAHEQIPQYISAFDIGVSPRATFYASPMKVPEYMACEKVVLAPHMPNLEDLITDSKDGTLFQPESIDDLSAKLMTLIQNNTQRRKIAVKARETILQKTTWQKNVAKITSIYIKISC